MVQTTSPLPSFPLIFLFSSVGGDSDPRSSIFLFCGWGFRSPIFSSSYPRNPCNQRTLWFRQSCPSTLPSFLLSALCGSDNPVPSTLPSYLPLLFCRRGFRSPILPTLTHKHQFKSSPFLTATIQKTTTQKLRTQ